MTTRSTAATSTTRRRAPSAGFSVTAKHVTKSAKLFHTDGTITAQDGSGREFDVDGEAAIYGNDDAKGFLDRSTPATR